MVTSTQIVREAPEIEALKRGLVESAKGLVEGYTIDPDTGARVPVTGGGRQILPTQQVAEFDPLQQQAYTSAQAPGGIGGYQPYMATGRGTLGTGLGTISLAGTPMAMAQQALYGSAGQFGGGPGYEAGGFDPQSVSAYMDPYEDAVVQQAMADIQRQGDIAQQGLSAQAVGAGAFGGSRQGIQQNEMNRNILEQQARTAAGLRSAGYQGAIGQAQQAFEAQQRRQQAQAQFGTQAQQQAFENQQRRQQQMAQLYGGIGQLYGGLGVQQAGIGGQQLGAAQLAQTTGLTDISTLSQLGGQQQARQQALLDAQRANEQRQLFEPYGRLGFLSDIYKGAPSTTMSLGSQLTPPPAQPSTLQQIGSLGVGLLGTTAAMRQFGAGGGGGGGGGLFGP